MSAEPDERKRALDRAVRALARRDHSAEAVRAKLERAGFAQEARDDVVGSLVRAGYLDDARFARERAAQLAGRGYGDEWISADLAAQGVSRAVAGDAVAALAPEPERALEHAARLGAPPRAARALARRGFSEDSIEAVLAGAVAEDSPPGVG